MTNPEASSPPESGSPLADTPRAWQRMLSGRRLDLLNPSPNDIEIEDIAHGLARVARWNGQTVGVHPFSVAQHSLVVLEIAQSLNPGWSAEWRLAALLHDAPEYVVGDLISPFKAALGLDYKSFELRLLDAVHERFAVPAEIPSTVAEAIKSADRIAAYYEATCLAGFERDEGEIYFGKPPALPHKLATTLASLTPWPTGQAQSEFLAGFNQLAGT